MACSGIVLRIASRMQEETLAWLPHRLASGVANARPILCCPCRMAAPENNPIRDEPVKPPMLNPVVRHVLPSGDLKWILVAVGLAAAVGLFALLFGTWY